MELPAMAILTLRKLPDEIHRALRVRAARHGHSIEAEVREILARAVKPEKSVRVLAQKLKASIRRFTAAR
jgi:plasmid stability protein